MELDEEAQERFLKHYIAYKRLKNFASLILRTQKGHLMLYLALNPGHITLEQGISRDVRQIGHHGNGYLEIIIANLDDLEKAKSLFKKSFDEN